MSPGPMPTTLCCHEPLVTLVPAYEPHMLFELEPPHLALCFFCFECLCPVWTIGSDLPGVKIKACALLCPV